MLCLTCCAPAYGAANTANVLTLNTSSTNVTTSAYVQLTASSSLVTSNLLIVNATTSVIKVAYGASGSETDLVAVAGSSWAQVHIGFPLVTGTRITVEAVNSTASSGYIAVSLLP